MKCALQSLTDDDRKQTLQDFLQEYPPGSKQAQRVVRLARFEKMYDSQKKRFCLHVKNSFVEDAVVDCIERSGVEEFLGPRPPGYLENEAQKMLPL